MGESADGEETAKQNLEISKAKIAHVQAPANTTMLRDLVEALESSWIWKEVSR